MRLALALLVVGYLCLSTVADHVSTVVEAHRLVQMGRQAQVTEAQVHITMWASKNGTRHWGVDGVRAVFAGGPPGGVTLDGVGSFEVRGITGDERWMPSAAGTGYLEPFSLHYAVEDDGQVVAMADSDIASWTVGGRLWWDASIAAFLFGVTLALWRINRSRRRRSPGRLTSPRPR